ncbi:hypothetical protein H7170_03410 [Candidatus Gracilibacteria bacterium]|nr:hypothetical protein [Candidatus Gracilibacteria bacterium]
MALLCQILIILATHYFLICLEFQSRESPHITIYYLDSILTDSEKKYCLELLDSWTTAKKRNIHLRSCKYFYRGGLPYILYIVPDNFTYFDQKNKQASEQFHSENIIDNQFPFVPHITIMRILEAEKFAPHSDTIENMIQSHIEGIWDDPAQDGFTLYSVDSRIQPELQERLALK